MRSSVSSSRASGEFRTGKLDYWLSLFVLEVRRQDKQPYPPNSLFNLVAGIQRFLAVERDCCDLNVFGKNSKVPRMRKALDCRMKELTAQGLGVNIKRADAVTLDDERALWSSNVFNMNTAKGLSYCVFFYNCKTFGLRGNLEHRNLDASQYAVRKDERGNSFVLFNSWNSKTFNGGLEHRRLQPRCIKQYDTDDDRCVFKIFALYLRMIPSYGAFCRKPLESAFAFGKQCVGINTLSSYMKRAYDDAKIDRDNRNIVNHSGRVACCTRLLMTVLMIR